MHLTNEQLEDALAGSEAASEHLRQCEACSGRLAEARALRNRLRAAAQSAEPSGDFVLRLRTQLAAAGVGADRKSGGNSRGRVIPFAPAIAVAAAVLILAIPAVLYFGTSNSRSSAAVADLVGIHQEGVRRGGAFHAESDLSRIADYLREHVGDCPGRPRVCKCTSVVGCCAADFHGRKVPAFCLDTPQGPVSIIIVQEPPAELGLTRLGQRNGLDVWTGQHKGLRVAAAENDGDTLCTIGALSHETLADLLTWSASAARTKPSGQVPFVCPFCHSKDQ